MPQMSIIYCDHAETRIKQRELDKKSIEAAINNPNNMMPSFGERSITQKKFNNKILEVVFKKLDGGIIVITAYWLKEA
ncbi:DUF4258 domain-containing protein [Candidatus Omnitrophota bacterium]